MKRIGTFLAGLLCCFAALTVHAAPDPSTAYFPNISVATNATLAGVASAGAVVATNYATIGSTSSVPTILISADFSVGGVMSETNISTSAGSVFGVYYDPPGPENDYTIATTLLSTFSTGTKGIFSGYSASPIFTDAENNSTNLQGSLIGYDAQTFNNPGGKVTLGRLIGARGYVGNFGDEVSDMHALEGYLDFTSSGETTNYVGCYIWVGPGTSPVHNDYAYWSDDLQSTATNSYYSWFNSRGVRRVKEDSTFDSVGQAIEALYNPQFTKYTPGASNYERVILGQWNGNVAEIGNQAGGTGTLRKLRLIGSSVEVPTGIGSLVSDTITTAATGATNTLSVNVTIYVTAATSATLKQHAGTTVQSGVTVAAWTPITLQPGGSFVGTGITYGSPSSSYAW